MKTNRILAGISLVLVAAFVLLAQSVTFAQRGGGGKNTCTNVPIEVRLANDGRIRGDGLPYNGTLFACGSNDATFGADRRPIAFNFGSPVPNSGQPDSWMVGEVSLAGGLNIQRLGTIRSEPTTTFMTGQFTGPNHKTYRFRMTPFEIGTGSPELLPDGSVNSPYETSPVTVSFSPGCDSTPGCTNPHGMWSVVGNNLSPILPGEGVQYEQVGTFYRVANTWIKVGQFSLPFSATVTALAPLPELP